MPDLLKIIATFEPSGDGSGQVVGDRPVELTGPGYLLQGKGFTLDLASGEIAVRGGTAFRNMAGCGAEPFPHSENLRDRPRCCTKWTLRCPQPP